MTAQELIEKLSQFPPDTKVQFKCYNTEFDEWDCYDVFTVLFKTEEEMVKENLILPQFAKDVVLLS